MKPQHSPPCQQASMSMSCFPATRTNCSNMHFNKENTCSYKAFLLHQPPGTHLSALNRRFRGVPRYSDVCLLLGKSCSAKPVMQPDFSVRSVCSLLRRRDQRRVTPCRYKRLHLLAQVKFSNRDPDPPGDPPWSSRLSNNSQTRIVPFTNRLVDDPLGKEAERETKIIRRYQICH